MALELRAPPRVSATQFTVGRACALRFVLDGSLADADRALASSTPSRYLGELFHGLVEDARTGKAGDPPDLEQLKSCWKQRIERVERSALERGDEAWLPLAETCENLERVRLRAVRLARRQPVRRGSGRGEPSTEAWLETADGLVVGRVDAIDREEGRVILRDFKSGSVVDHAEAMKAEYHLQMLVYAGVLSELGSPPDALELIDGNGLSHPVPMEPGEPLSVLQECRDFLLDIHRVVGAGRDLRDPELAALAAPGDVCSACQHRPICPAYDQSLAARGLTTLDDSPFPVVDMMGRVSEAISEEDRCSLRIECAGTTRSIRRVEARRFTRGGNSWTPTTEIRNGEQVYVYGAVPRLPVTVDPEVGRVVTAPCTRAFLPDRESGAPGQPVS